MMTLLTTSIDRDLVQNLIDFVHNNHSDLQIYDGIFSGHQVVTFGMDVDLKTITAVELPKAYTMLALNLLGETPMIVGYTYHNWHDSPQGSRGKTVTLSNRSSLYENNERCTTLRWTTLVDGSIQFIITIEAFPKTWEAINDDPSSPIPTPVGRASFTYKVDTWGGCQLVMRTFGRIEETRGSVGIDRYNVQVSINSAPEREYTFQLRIDRITNIHAYPSAQTKEELVITKNKFLKIAGKAPFGWEHLTAIPNEDVELAVDSAIRGLSENWDSISHWIC